MFSVGDKVAYTYPSKKLCGEIISAGYAKRERAMIYEIQWNDGAILFHTNLFIRDLSEEEYAALVLMGNDV